MNTVPAYNRAAMTLVCVLVMVAFGCSRQKRFANRIAVANRVIVSNCAYGFTASLNSQDLSNLVRAVSSARKERPFVDAGLELWIGFFNNTNALGAINVSSRIFAIEGESKLYADATGTLEGITRRFRERRALSFSAMS